MFIFLDPTYFEKNLSMCDKKTLHITFIRDIVGDGDHLVITWLLTSLDCNVLCKAAFFFVFSLR